MSEINEDEREFDIYGEPYDDILNPKREEDRVYDKNGKLKGEDDTDYEKMLSGESAPNKKSDGKILEGEDITLDDVYPEMRKEEDKKNSEEEYSSMKDLPDKRDDTGIPASEEDKKQMDKEYPEMVKAGIPDLQ